MTNLLPWIFAAVAAGIVWWCSRSPALAFVPPVPPLPSVPAPGGASALPPLPGAAPVGGGLSPFLLGAIVIPWGLIAWSHLGAHRPAPDTPDAPPAVEGLDLRGLFRGPDAFADAALTAALTDQVADAIEVDGTIDLNGDGRIDEPRLLTGRQVWELRNVARAYRTGGVLLGDKQPKVRDAIKDFLDREAGKSSGPLDTESKARWVKAFRKISEACRQAIGLRKEAADAPDRANAVSVAPLVVAAGGSSLDNSLGW